MANDSTFCTHFDEEAYRRFEQTWCDGCPRPLEEFLPPSEDPLYLGTLEELIALDLEFRWKTALATGDATTAALPPRLEHYLERFPGLHGTPALGRLLKEEIRLRHRHGERPDTEEYRQRFPEEAIDRTLWEETARSPVVRPAPPAAPTLAPGMRVGRYRLAVQHARGGFGLVWRADDEVLGREVALKQLSDSVAADPGFRQRFVAEARIAAQLQHPGVVPVYDVGEADGPAPYYTMKLLRGQTLTEAIRRFHDGFPSDAERNLEQLRLLNAFLAVVRTMAYAHARHVLHRDLKPDNILLGDYGETVVLDWGLAKVLTEGNAPGPVPSVSGSGHAEQTQDGTVVGTPAYMAPEQARGDLRAVDARSDVYGLGAILHQLLTGRPPYEGATAHDIHRQVLAGEPVPPRVVRPGAPRPLEAICRRAMARRPEDRYPLTDELARDLERYLADEPVLADREPWPERLSRWARRHRTQVVAGLVALVLTVVGTLTGLFLWHEEQQRQQKQEEKHLAELRRSAQAGETFALVELRQGRFASAARLLTQALASLENEGRLTEEAESLHHLHRWAHRLDEYQRLNDAAEKFAFLEHDREARRMCEQALDVLGVPRTREWRKHLPIAELTDPNNPEVPDGPLRQLEQDVYRTGMLLAALYLKGALMKPPGDPEGDRDLKAAEALVTLDDPEKPSFCGNLVSNVCRFKRGEVFSLLRRPSTVEPNSAADYYFAGMAHVWAAEGMNDEISKVARFLGPAVNLDLTTPRLTAERYLRTAMDLAPRHYWTRLWLAWSYRVGGDLKSAAAALDACTALRPGYGLSYAERARAVAFQMRSLDPAQIAAAVAARDRWGLLGQIKAAGPPPQRAERERQALADLDRAAQLDPEEAYIHSVRAIVLWHLGRYDAALEACAIQLEKEKPLEELQGQVMEPTQRALLENLRNFAQRMTATQGAGPDTGKAWAVLALAELALGRMALAETAAARVPEGHPDRVRALHVRGAVRLQRGDFAGALADCKEVLRRQPKNSRVALLQGRAYEGLGQWTEALAIYEALLTEAPVDWQRAESRLGQARTLWQLGRVDEARAALERVRSHRPEAAAVLEAQIAGRNDGR